ncbi:hypothetical protein [Niallia sp. FSL W8-0635]|uniref:hypothetical protein n=1 Tax=Niallia sp. FSL W8-0635 TaxID=2975337 RepID=UPI0009CD132B|nr:Uncharacterised protein [Mycobacteroides abscessus subsp. abscessus]HEO8420930.1 hypothetical protein [Yersinia enterocolitica]
MNIKSKICISICIFSLCLLVGIFLNSFQKREFYSLDELLLIEEDDSLFPEETMIPFQPREYIRKMAVE